LGHAGRRFSLGIANKFLEPYAGAVLGKIMMLVFIILFIQKRPRGLFALKGRAVESMIMQAFPRQRPRPPASHSRHRAAHCRRGLCRS
jgi:hypothetical protein